MDDLPELIDYFMDRLKRSRDGRPQSGFLEKP